MALILPSLEIGETPDQAAWLDSLVPPQILAETTP
jgi:hypothetical protein